MFPNFIFKGKITTYKAGHASKKVRRFVMMRDFLLS